MAQIELGATDTEIVDRLALLLEHRVGGEFTTTAVLAVCTTIFVWVAKRVRRNGDPAADAIRGSWEKQLGGSDPWRFPNSLALLSVFEGIVRLRNATSHADGASVHPLNEEDCLLGFTLEADQAPIQIREDELRRLGL
ncbi:MAG: hypothetical protein EON96_18500, partial [Caulobacteraceae bacterium]